MKEEVLNLINLKYFCDAAKLGGVSAASKANFVTQSAISQAISKLEISLGVTLVARHPNRFRLAPAGESVFIQGLKILGSAAEFKKSFLLEENQWTGDLEFACTHSLAVAVIPPILYQFQKKYPEVKVHFNLGTSDSIKQMVKSGFIDFGILPEKEISDEKEKERFEYCSIFSGDLKLYISKKIKSNQKKTMSFILGPSQGDESIYFRNEFRRKFAREPSCVLEVGSWEVMINLVAEGMGIGYLPDYIAKKNQQLKEYDLGLKLQRYKISAIYPSGMKLRKSSDFFLSLLKSAS